MTIHRPHLSRQQLTTFYPDGFSVCQEYFFNFETEYNQPALPISDPSYDWGGVQFATFACRYEDFENPTINNLSLVTFAKYMGWTFIFPGDIEEEGWHKLMENESFRNWLSGVSVFVASHHGREAGFCNDVFQLCQPLLTIVSDKNVTDTDFAGRYYQVSRGLNVVDDLGQITNRSVMTTRSDGAILVEIDEAGRGFVKGYRY